MRKIILPYWHMWYLYALIIWQLSLPIVEKVRKYMPKQALLVVYTAIALLSGKVDYWPLALARVLVFYTFFLTGYLYKDELVLFFQKRRNTSIFIIYCLILLILCIGVGLKAESINVSAMWEYQSYTEGNYTMLERLLFFIRAFLFCIPLFAISGAYRSYFLICLGKKTLAIYIFHAAFFKVFNVLIKNIDVRYGWIRIICTIIAIVGVISFLQSNFIQKCVDKISCIFVRYI